MMNKRGDGEEATQLDAWCEMLGAWVEHDLLSSLIFHLKSFGKPFHSILTNSYVEEGNVLGKQGML